MGLSRAARVGVCDSIVKDLSFAKLGEVTISSSFTALAIDGNQGTTARGYRAEPLAKGTGTQMTRYDRRDRRQPATSAARRGALSHLHRHRAGEGPVSPRGLDAAGWVSQKDITVWCGNDYLGMGQHPEVLAAMHEALDATGRRVGRNAEHQRHHSLAQARWRRSWPTCTGKEAALVFTSAYIANDATLSTLRVLFPGLIIYSDALNHASMIEGDPARRWREADLPAQ